MGLQRHFTLKNLPTNLTGKLVVRVVSSVVNPPVASASEGHPTVGLLADVRFHTQMVIQMTIHSDVRHRLATLFADDLASLFVEFFLGPVCQLLFSKPNQLPFRWRTVTLLGFIVKLQRGDAIVVIGVRVLVFLRSRTFWGTSNATFGGCGHLWRRYNILTTMLQNRKSNTGRSVSERGTILLSLSTFMFEFIKFIDFVFA